ncbi:MAG TPA: hypothetical protein DIU00_00840 [Phycisphaerales bacterium]|nr:hypothetical protein [Phycisphaerales bacterium]
MPALQISDNGRFLVRDDGTPFFWLADTAWQLFQRLDRGEVDEYLQDRAKKGFTVIQAVIFWGGVNEKNRYGDQPFVGGDPAKVNEAYFRHVDYTVDKASSLGLRMGLLPVWAGSHIRPKKALFNLSNKEKAHRYGLFLGERYRDKPVVWILGGDWPGEGLELIFRAMAKGLAERDGGKHLMTYHPRGGGASSTWFHDDAWLDFNMVQSGHSFENRNYEMIAEDYRRRPAKPVIDGEPGYEDHPARFDPKYGWLSAPDVRRFAYCAVFAGAAGHTYGCHDIWQFWQPDRKPITYARTPWKKALQLPGAGQMQYLRRLVESRPMLIRVPDQALIEGSAMRTTDRIQATRGADGSYAFVYIASGKPVTIRTDKLSGSAIKAYWFDPRSGTSRVIKTFARAKRRQFTPPSSGKGNDWVLVLDDAAKDFASPGRNVLK